MGAFHVTGSLGQTVHTLKWEMKDRGLDFGEDFDRLLDVISGCEDLFNNKRNTSIHEFCVVTEDNLKYRMNNGGNFNEATAQLGATLTKCLVRDVDHILRTNTMTNFMVKSNMNFLEKLTCASEPASRNPEISSEVQITLSHNNPFLRTL